MNAHVYPAGSVFRSLSDIAGQKITVMGVGLNGGGAEAIRFFLRHGASVTATDTKDERALAPTLDALTSEAGAGRLRFVLGRHEKADFAGADAVIKNPVVRFEGNGFLAASRAVETDLSVFLSLSRAPLLAVTGSKGKSTAASAAHFGLSAAGFRAFLGGNITVSPLAFLEETGPETPVVLELSSWQLRDLRGRGLLKPRAAVLTAIMSDHQNWYGSMAEYVADKKLIYAEQGPEDLTVCLSGAWGDVFASETKARVIRVDTAQAEQEAPLAPLAPGAHTRVNVRAAFAALTAFGADEARVRAALASWRGIPHRLEFFHEWVSGAGGRVRFYNDTAATVPEAAAAACAAFDAPVRLIAGGTDKCLDFAPLAAALAGDAGARAPASVFLLAGSGTDRLAALLRARGTAYRGPFDSLEALLAALKAHLDAEAAGDEAAVFSPGAASFGMFRNEFERGDEFRRITREIFTAGRA